MRNLIARLIFGSLLFGLIVVSCSPPASEPAPPSNTAYPQTADNEQPVIAENPHPTRTLATATQQSIVVGAPLPAAPMPATGDLPPAEELPVCSTCPLLKPDRQRELQEDEYRGIVSKNAGFKDIQAFAEELGYKKFITAGEIVYDDQSVLTTGIFASDDEKIILVHGYQSKDDAYFLRQFENYELKGEELVSGTLHVFDRTGGARIDLVSGEMSYEGGHHSCNFWHCFGVCLSFTWSNYSIGYFCKLWIPLCIADLTRASCLPLVFCAALSGSYCYTSCELNECNFCRSDNCGEDEDIGVPECLNYIGGPSYIVQPYKHYYCATDPVYYYDSELAECEWTLEYRRLQTCPQGCSAGQCVNFTATATRTRTVTPTRTSTITKTPTTTKTFTSTALPTATKTSTPTRTMTPTRTATRTPTSTPTPTPTHTMTPTRTPVLGIHLNGFVGKTITTPYENGMDDIYIYVYWMKTDKLILAGVTDAGYIQKVWVPYPEESKVYVFVSATLLEHLEQVPPITEFTPDYYTWFHNIGEETVTVEFYLD